MLLTRKSAIMIQEDTGISLSELADYEFLVDGSFIGNKDNYLTREDIWERRNKIKNMRFPEPHNHWYSLSKLLSYFR